MIKTNLHGPYIENNSSAAHLPPEMLDYIDEHLGGVDKFIELYNKRALNDETMLRGLKQSRDIMAKVLDIIKELIADTKDGEAQMTPTGLEFKQVFDNLNRIIASVEDNQ